MDSNRPFSGDSDCFFPWFDQPFVMGDFSNENWYGEMIGIFFGFFLGISSIRPWGFSVEGSFFMAKKTATTVEWALNALDKPGLSHIFHKCLLNGSQILGFALKRWLQALLILKCIARQSACERVLRNIAYRMRPGTTVEEEWEETRTLSQESTSQVIPWIQIWFLHRTSANFSSHVFGLTMPSTFYSTCADV